MPDSIINSINEVKKLGYKYEFRFHEGKLINRTTNKTYLREQFNIDKELRIEGNSDPADASILFAISCHDGIKGHFSSAYGIYADTDLFDFLKE